SFTFQHAASLYDVAYRRCSAAIAPPDARYRLPVAVSADNLGPLPMRDLSFLSCPRDLYHDFSPSRLIAGHKLPRSPRLVRRRQHGKQPDAGPVVPAFLVALWRVRQERQDERNEVAPRRVRPG